MAEETAQGSLLYKILIAILAVVLIASILYPKRLKERAEQNAAIAHYRMEEVQKMALQYQKYNAVYNDTLDVLFDFIRVSPQYQHYVDSVVVTGLDSIITKLGEFSNRQENIRDNIVNATDSVMIDSLVRLQNTLKMDSRLLAGYIEYIHDRMKNLPNMPVDDLTAAFVIIDSKQFTLNMDIVRNSISNGSFDVADKACGDVVEVINNSISQIQDVADRVPDYKNSNLEALAHCPTTNKLLMLVHVDTAVIKYLNIYCPIDSADIEIVESNFLMSKIGGLDLSNHGKIESGEKSWDVQ